MGAIKRGIRNTFRNSIRAVGIIAILGIAIALSVSMVVARSAANNEISKVRSTNGTSVVVTPPDSFGQFGSTYLSVADETKLRALDHVTAAVGSLNANLSSTDTSLTVPTFTPPGGSSNGFGGGGGGNFLGFSRISVIGTDTPATAVVNNAFGGGTEKLTSGTTFAAGATTDVAIVGANLASTNNLIVGDSFTAWGATIKVIGIYNAQSTFANNDILMPLATVQKLSGLTTDLRQITLTVNTVANVSSVQKAAAKLLGSAASVTDTAQAAQEQLSPLNTVKSTATYSLIGTVIAAGVILLLSMLMIVRERRREIGVLKALGAKTRTVMGQFVAESVTFTLIASAVGLGLGVLLANPITTALNNSNSNPAGSNGNFTPGRFGGGGGGGFPGFHHLFTGGGATFRTLQTSIGGSTLLFALLVALVVAIIGSSVAAATVARIRPAEVLRSE